MLCYAESKLQRCIAAVPSAVAVSAEASSTESGGAGRGQLKLLRQFASAWMSQSCAFPFIFLNTIKAVVHTPSVVCTAVVLYRCTACTSQVASDLLWLLVGKCCLKASRAQKSCIEPLALR